MVGRKKVKKKKATIATKANHGSDSISDNVAAFVNGHIKFDKEQFKKQFAEVQTKMEAKKKKSSSSSSSNDDNDNINMEKLMAKVEDHHCNAGLSGLWIWFKNNHIGFIFAMLLQLFTLFAMKSTVLSIMFHMNQIGIYDFVTKYVDLKEYDLWLKKHKTMDSNDKQLEWLLEVLNSEEFQSIIMTDENEKAMRSARSYKDVVGDRNLEVWSGTISCSHADLNNRFIDHVENFNCLDDKRFLENESWLNRKITFKMGKRLAKALSCMLGKEIEKEVEEKKFESPLFTFIYQHVVNTIIFICRYCKNQFTKEDYDDLFLPNATSSLRNGVSLSSKINDVHTFEFSLFDGALPPTTAKMFEEEESGGANDNFINKLLTMIYETRVGRNFSKKNSGFQSILQYGLLAKVLQSVAPDGTSRRKATMAFAKNIKHVLNKKEGLSYFKKKNEKRKCGTKWGIEERPVKKNEDTFDFMRRILLRVSNRQQGYDDGEEAQFIQVDNVTERRKFIYEHELKDEEQNIKEAQALCLTYVRMFLFQIAQYQHRELINPCKKENGKQKKRKRGTNGGEETFSNTAHPFLYPKHMYDRKDGEVYTCSAFTFTPREIKDEKHILFLKAGTSSYACDQFILTANSLYAYKLSDVVTTMCKESHYKYYEASLSKIVQTYFAMVVLILQYGSRDMVDKDASKFPKFDGYEGQKDVVERSVPRGLFHNIIGTDPFTKNSKAYNSNAFKAFIGFLKQFQTGNGSNVTQNNLTHAFLTGDKAPIVNESVNLLNVNKRGNDIADELQKITSFKALETQFTEIKKNKNKSYALEGCSDQSGTASVSGKRTKEYTEADHVQSLAEHAPLHMSFFANIIQVAYNLFITIYFAAMNKPPSDSEDHVQKLREDYAFVHLTQMPCICTEDEEECPIGTISYHNYNYLKTYAPLISKKKKKDMKIVFKTKENVYGNEDGNGGALFHQERKKAKTKENPLHPADEKMEIELSPKYFSRAMNILEYYTKSETVKKLLSHLYSSADIKKMVQHVEGTKMYVTMLYRAFKSHHTDEGIYFPTLHEIGVLAFSQTKDMLSKDYSSTSFTLLPKNVTVYLQNATDALASVSKVYEKYMQELYKSKHETTKEADKDKSVDDSSSDESSSDDDDSSDED